MLHVIMLLMAKNSFWNNQFVKIKKGKKSEQDHNYKYT